MHLFPSWFSRRFFARLISTLICTILVLRPFNKYAGQSAFLALTIKELVFSVQESLAQQLEATVLHLLGGLVAIGWSMLGKYVASLAPEHEPLARAIPAIFLAVFSFFAGWLKSRLPRLTLSTRIAGFIAIWLLTADVGAIQSVLTEARNFLWITSIAASTSLFASMLLLRWSSPQIARDIAAAFANLHIALQSSLDKAFPRPNTTAIGDPAIHRLLLKQSVALNSTYHQASFELRLGRVGVKTIKPLIGSVENFPGGMSPQPSHRDSPLETHTFQSFDNSAIALGSAIIESLSIIENIVLACFERVYPPSPLQVEKAALLSAQNRLEDTLEKTRNELMSFCDELDRQHRTLGGDSAFPQKIFDLCLFVISLVQMARDTRHALQVCGTIITAYESSPLRLWHPHLSWVWLGVTPSTIILDERGTFLDEDEEPETRTNLSMEETREGIAESSYVLEPETDRRIILTKPKIRGKLFSLHRLNSIRHYLWNHPRTIRGRLALSRFARSIQHSPHLKHALKNAVGIALLGIPAFLPPDSAGRQWFNLARGQWMLISYLWVLETNSGATWRVAYLRLSGTVLGALYAYIASLICGANPYGIVALITAAELPISWIVINTSRPSLGVVASVTLPPIIFRPYFNSSPPVTTLNLALWRGAMISVGIIAALLMNSLVFPRHCRVMFLNSACRTLGFLSQLYMGLSRDLFQGTHTSSVVDKRKALKLELSIRNSLHRMSILIITMNDELSLVPKPMQRYRQIVAVLQKLLDLLTGLRKIRENIPRKATVHAVVEERKQFASCVCISLFACEQVFGARQPLPQFLPSARQALVELERNIRQSRAEDPPDSLGLSLVYALAEIDALTDVVDVTEELLDLSRQLFGTSSWFELQASEGNMTMSV